MGVLCEKTNETPPYTHRLMALVDLASLHPSEEQRDFLNLLTRYYIKTRYPEQKEKLSKDLDRKKTTKFLKKTREHFLWLKKELEI